MNASRPASDSTSASPAGLEPLYPVSELAQLWRCSPQHIYTLIAAGELRTFDVGVKGAKTRIPASAVAEFVARRSIKAKTGRKPRTTAA
jgi:excisionase family DNA binding protein